MNAAINEQIGREFAASLEYVSIAAGFASGGLTELAKHFYRQAEEERDYAMRFVKFVVDAGGEVAIPAIPRPQERVCGRRGSGERLARVGSDRHQEHQRFSGIWRFKRPITPPRTFSSGLSPSSWKKYPAWRHC
jgi:rubrerythrin